MSGVGEILGGIALVEPCFKACLEAYGFYKLTKNFGHDYQKAERALRGQAARLRVLGDTRISNLLLVPEEGTQLAETTISTLQGMRNNFEQCEALMKAHGELRRSERPMRQSPSTDFLSPSVPHSPSLRAESPSSFKEKFSKGLSFRRHKYSHSASSAERSTSSANSSDTVDTIATSPSSISLLPHGSKLMQGAPESSAQAQSFQASSTLLNRLRWALEDRNRFFEAVEELTRANDLLESLIRIKSLDDPNFQNNGHSASNEFTESLSGIRCRLEMLHKDLMAMNPRGKDVQFSLKLVVDESELKHIYCDYIDAPFDHKSWVYSLQTHSWLKHQDEKNSYYLLAETACSQTTNNISKLSQSLLDINKSSDPPFRTLNPATSSSGSSINTRLFQDRTSEWNRTHTLARALQNQSYQSCIFQRQYVKLGQLIAFSYAVLGFTYDSAVGFPQASHYSYYDQVSDEKSGVDVKHPRTSDDGKYLKELDGTDSISSNATNSNIFTDEQRDEMLSVFEEFLVPWFHFRFGARPEALSTKALGKKPGFTAMHNNAVVALGLLLYQIGSWRSLTSGDIIRMRCDALERPEDLIRLSGVQFAEITRTCLNWRDSGPNGIRLDSKDMLLNIYGRLDAYHKQLEQLM